MSNGENGFNSKKLSDLIDFEFDHVGIAVRSLEEGSRPYEAMGLVISEEEIVEREKVKVKMFELGNNSRIELLQPLNNESVLAKFIEKRGTGIHHICLRVKNIRSVLSKLKVSGVRLIHEEPFVGAHNCNVAFIHPSSMGGVLIELSEPGDIH